ncbi:MAG: hypothetical protein K1X89_01310 [Myxococcaceae bacterium]|nr:hypothetical protein [Myxococcaceae bacterium]
MPAEDSAVVCPNIGPKERRLRNIVGVVSTAVTLLLVGAFLEAGFPWAARFAIALPAYVAAMGFLQARAQTCVAFAKQNIRVLGDSRQDRLTPSEREAQAIKVQARKVYQQAFIATAVVTGVVLLIPSR